MLPKNLQFLTNTLNDLNVRIEILVNAQLQISFVEIILRHPLEISLIENRISVISIIRD